jgi:type IV pilus assembly protein PilZ
MTADSDDRRSFERFATRIAVDCRSGENFLFAHIENISEMGLFVRSDEPLPLGTELELAFEHEGTELALEGIVVWVNPVRADGENLNPGMGVSFRELSDEQRDALFDIIRTIAYLHETVDAN